MSCGLPGPLLCSGQSETRRNRRPLLFRQCHRLDLASAARRELTRDNHLVPESRGLTHVCSRKTAWVRRALAPSKGSNLFLCSCFLASQKANNEGCRGNRAAWRCLPASDHRPREGQIHLGLLLVPTAKGCGTSPRLVEHP